MYHISELRLGQYTLHIKMVPHTKIQLVLMSIGYYFGTTHSYIHICNKRFLRQIFFFSRIFFLLLNFFPVSTLPIIPTLLSKLIFERNFMVIVDMYVHKCSTPISFFFLHFWQFMFKPDSHLVLFASEGGQGPRRNSGALHSIFGALQ